MLQQHGPRCSLAFKRIHSLAIHRLGYIHSFIHAMKLGHNIEKSPFRKGEYVGYANGVWHIRKSTSAYGQWCATHQSDRNAPRLYSWRLSDMSIRLEEYAAPWQPIIKKC